jgi:hypothetical protein
MERHRMKGTSMTAEAAVNRIGVEMHGVHLTLEANHVPLLAYAIEHLNGLVRPPAAAPDLLVRCSWSRGVWDPQVNPFPTNGTPLNVVGKRMLGNAEELIWLDTLRTKGLQLRFELKPGRLVFDVSCRFNPKQEKLRDYEKYEYKRYFGLMSYLVYYPLFWYFEQLRGWVAVHASALASRGRGVVIAGLGGVGKTTTCVALMERAGMELISENLILTDGEHVYPCHEPIRLDAGSLAALGEEPKGLKPMAFPDGLKDKRLFHPSGPAAPSKVKPAVVFLPTFSARRYVRPLPSPIAAERIVATNRLTRELDDYGWYAAAPNMIWATPRRTGELHAVPHELASRARCFELGIDRGGGIDAVVEDIVSTLERS